MSRRGDHRAQLLLLQLRLGRCSPRIALDAGANHGRGPPATRSPKLDVVPAEHPVALLWEGRDAQGHGARAPDAWRQPAAGAEHLQLGGRADGGEIDGSDGTRGGGRLDARG